MFAFIDESYQAAKGEGVFFTTYAAVLISRDTSREFSRGLFNLKKKFWSTCVLFQRVWHKSRVWL